MRYLAIDSIRGISVLGMILYHAEYILIHIFGIRLHLIADEYIKILGPIVAITFIFLAGFSFFLSSRNKGLGFLIRKALLRAGILGVIALCISYITYSFFYDQRIGFGIIHFFALSSLLSLLFIRTVKWNILFGIGILLIGSYFSVLDAENLWLMPFGIAPKEYFSADYYPLFPWFGYFLIGQSCAYWMNQFNILSWLLWKNNIILSPLIFIGQNALLFYIIHVPLLYIVFSLLF